MSLWHDSWIRRVTNPREQGRRGTVLYNLDVKVNLAQYRRGLHKALNIKGKNRRGPSWRLATIVLSRVFFFFQIYKFSLYIHSYLVEIRFCTRSLFYLGRTLKYQHESQNRVLKHNNLINLKIISPYLNKEKQFSDLTAKLFIIYWKNLPNKTNITLNHWLKLFRPGN